MDNCKEIRPVKRPSISGAFSKHVVQVWDFEEDVLPDIRDAEHNIITNSAIMVSCHLSFTFYNSLRVKYTG